MCIRARSVYFMSVIQKTYVVQLMGIYETHVILTRCLATDGWAVEFFRKIKLILILFKFISV